MTTGAGVTGWILGLGAAFAVAALWVGFISPNPRIELPGPARLGLEFVVWIAVGAALWATGHAEVGIVFAAVAVLSGVANHVGR